MSKPLTFINLLQTKIWEKLMRKVKFDNHLKVIATCRCKMYNVHCTWTSFWFNFSRMHVVWNSSWYCRWTMAMGDWITRSLKKWFRSHKNPRKMLKTRTRKERRENYDKIWFLKLNSNVPKHVIGVLELDIYEIYGLLGIACMGSNYIKPWVRGLET